MMLFSLGRCSQARRADPSKCQLVPSSFLRLSPSSPEGGDQLSSLGAIDLLHTGGSRPELGRQNLGKFWRWRWAVNSNTATPSTNTLSTITLSLFVATCILAFKIPNFYFKMGVKNSEARVSLGDISLTASTSHPSQNRPHATNTITTTHRQARSPSSRPSAHSTTVASTLSAKDSRQYGTHYRNTGEVASMLPRKCCCDGSSRTCLDPPPSTTKSDAFPYPGTSWAQSSPGSRFSP